MSPLRFWWYKNKWIAFIEAKTRDLGKSMVQTEFPHRYSEEKVAWGGLFVVQSVFPERKHKYMNPCVNKYIAGLIHKYIAGLRIVPKFLFVCLFV